TPPRERSPGWRAPGRREESSRKAAGPGRSLDPGPPHEIGKRPYLPPRGPLFMDRLGPVNLEAPGRHAAVGAQADDQSVPFDVVRHVALVLPGEGLDDLAVG